MGSDDDNETETKTEAPKIADAWDESEESDAEQEAPAQTTTIKSSNANSLDASDESEPEQSNDTKAKTIATTEEKNDANSEEKTNVFSDAEKIKRLEKKMKNYKKKQKRKKKKKSKPKPPPQKSNDVRKKDDDSSSSSSSDDDNANKKNGPKMQSYEERMKTDNEILFKGTSSGKAAQAEPDNRVMLSGEVSLANFPLGSARDCENLAEQVSALLQQSLFEDKITPNDVFAFYKKLLSSNILEKLDMVDTKALTTKMNSILTGKQKAWHKKKNPKGNKKKKPQWIVSDKFAGGGGSKGQHVDGGYDPNEFSMFD